MSVISPVNKMLFKGAEHFFVEAILIVFFVDSSLFKSVRKDVEDFGLRIA